MEFDNREQPRENIKKSDFVNKRKEKIKAWLKNPYNLIFLGILILGFIIRLYYFNLTKSQPLWWDESDYMAYAKNLAGFNVDWIATPEHKSLFSFIAALFFKIGLSGEIVKFFVQIVPSVLSIFLVYLICNEMYKDKRIGLVSAFLMATLWDHLFNTMRFHIDISALFTGLLAIYVFWKGYENKEKIFGKVSSVWAIPLTVLLVVLTYGIRRGHFLFGVFFFIYMLSTRKLKNLLKDKYNWISLVLVVILLFLAEKFIFASEQTGVGAYTTYFHPENKINFLPLGIFPSYFDSLTAWPSILLYLYWIGFIILIFNIFLSFGHIKNMESGNVRSDLFNVIAIVITLAFFIFIVRSPTVLGESRWYLTLALGAFVCISKASLIIIDLIKPYSKYIAFGLLIIMIGIGGYYELRHADDIIKVKIGSYEGIKQAGLYLKEIANEDDLIISVPEPQTEYYAERIVVHPVRLIGWNGTDADVPMESVMEKIRENKKIKYFLVSFSEPHHPVWMMKTYYANQNGQTVMAGWEIPFMETKIDFINNQQDIKQEKTYGDITFKLLNIKQDVFIYEIIRTGGL